MTRLAWLLAGALILAAVSNTSALAAEPAAETPAPATAEPPSVKVTPTAAPAEPPAGELIPAIVKVVEGTVETRPAVGQPWTAVAVGQTLAEGADIRTGFRARCVLDLSDSLVQVDPLTVIRIGTLRKDGNTVHTRILMKQGNTQADVEKDQIKSDFAIVMPSATLSVRGTQGIQAGFYQGVSCNIQLKTLGKIALTGRLGNTTPLSPGQQTDGPDTSAADYLTQQRQNATMNTLGTGLNEQQASGRRNDPLAVPPTSQGPVPNYIPLQQDRPGLTYTGPCQTTTCPSQNEESGSYEYEPR